MRVDGEEQEVTPGALIFVPMGAAHSIRNIGQGRLVCITAASPPFDLDEVEMLGVPYEAPPGAMPHP
jgi:mannose-6-phosphate isomerase-like protein (cupin superfamily)